MKLNKLLLIALLFTNIANANTYTTKILTSSCTLYKKESNTAAVVAGGVLGAVTGAYLGKKLFKNNKTLSTAVGTGAGLVIGNEIGSKKTYSCLITFKDRYNIIQQQSLIGKERLVNDIITISETNNGLIID